jgi:TrkA domain protein
MDEDEADHVANILHSRPIPDRLADLERRFTQITGEEG